MFDCPQNRDAKKCSLCRQLGHENRQCQSRRGRGGFNQQRARQQQAPQQRDEDAGHYANAAASEGGDDDYAFTVETVLATSMSDLPDRSKIVLDSGSTLHLCNSRRNMRNIREVHPPISLRVADGKVLQLREQGDMVVKLRGGRSLTLKDVALDHRLAANLLSVPRLTAAGYTVSFEDERAVIRKQGPSGSIVCIAPKQHNLYVIKQEADGPSTASAGDSAPLMSESESGSAAMMSSELPAVHQSSPSASSKSHEQATDESVLELWHRRLGHASIGRVVALSHTDALAGLPKMSGGAWESRSESAETTCEACALGKKHRHKFASEKAEVARASRPLERVHADLVGPITMPASVNEQQVLVSSLGGNRYASVKIDEATSKVWVEPIRTKADTAADLLAWVKRAQQASGCKLRELHTDGGSEYLDSKLQSFLTAEGIEHTQTQPYTPQHNGKAERVNRTLFECARSMLQHAKLGPEFWALAVQAAAYLLNRTKTVRRVVAAGGSSFGSAVSSTDASVSHPSLSSTYHLLTPEEAFTHRKPSCKHLRIMFSDCFVHVPDSKRTKMEPKAHRAILVGYPESQPGWRVLNLETGKVHTSREVSFMEGRFSFRGDALNTALGKEGAYAEEKTIAEMIDAMSYEQALAKVIVESKVDHEKQAREARRNARGAAAVKPKAAVSAVGSGVSGAEANPSALPLQAQPDLPLLPQAPIAAADAAAAAGVQPIIAAVEAEAADQPQIAAQPVQVEPNRRLTRAAAARAASALFISEADPDSASKSDSDLDQTHPRSLEHAFQVTASLAESESGVPLSYADAMRRQPAEAAAWLEAMEKEMQAHRANSTWDLIDCLPLGRKAIGCKWVLVMKGQADGSRVCKARLTAKGFSSVQEWITLRPLLRR